MLHLAHLLQQEEVPHLAHLLLAILLLLLPHVRLLAMGAAGLWHKNAKLFFSTFFAASAVRFLFSLLSFAFTAFDYPLNRIGSGSAY